MTRHVSLLPLSGGGYLADTPGFNQPSLLKVTKQSLAQTFPEVSLFKLYPTISSLFTVFPV
jgi:putative ribosome biogenesis GTPase RsgA